MTKKLGILTFHRANNYGAVMQAYSLKKSLQKLGTEAKIINYLSPKIEEQRPFNFNKFNLKKLLKIPFNYILDKRFSSFRKFFLTDTPQYIEKDLEKLTDYNAFITGSDQVFNPSGSNFDGAYFLSFVKKSKKYSYAASFGKSFLSDKDKNFIAPLIKDFSNLSVRESIGIDIIRDLTGQKSCVNLDPIFLLNKEEWIQISKQVKEKDYILVYLMHNDGEIFRFVDKLAQDLKLKTIIITTVVRDFLISKNTIIPNPQDWLGYFINAKYIVTNSFHGTAFSINFNKKFFVDFLHSSANVNSRLENILDLFDLRDRLIDNIGADYDRPIDYDRVNKILELEREKSINYLKEIIR